MATNVKVQVKVSDLIVAVEAHDAECMKTYEDAVKAYNLAFNSWRKSSAQVLRDVAKELDNAKTAKGFSRTDRHGYTKRTITDAVRGASDRMPTIPAKPGGSKRLLEMLRMSAKETYSLSEEQYRHWMDRCAL